MTPEQAHALVEAFDAIPDHEKHRAIMGLIARLANQGAAQFFLTAMNRIEPEWAQDCADRMQ